MWLDVWKKIAEIITFAPEYRFFFRSIASVLNGCYRFVGPQDGR